MRKQPERTAKTKQKIVDSFWELYCEKRIEKITVREISQSAGIYRSTFYEYFSDIYEILHTVEEEILKDFHTIWGSLFDSENIDEATAKVMSFYKKNGEKMVVLLGPGGDQNFYVNMKNSAKKILCSKLDIKENDIYLDMVLAAIPPVIISLLQYWYEHKEDIEFSHILEFGSSFIKEGALPVMKKLGVKFTTE